MKFEEVLPRLREGDVIFLERNGDTQFYYRAGKGIQGYCTGIDEIYYLNLRIDADEMFDDGWGIVSDFILNEHIRLGLRK